MLRLVFLLLCYAPLAQAGPWPREKGTGFSANSMELTGLSLRNDLMQAPYYSSFYLEYGLSQSFTIGLHGGHGSSAPLAARAFVRLPLGKSDTHKFAAEISLGQEGESPFVALGLQYGRGLTLFQRPGWLSVESRFDFGGPVNALTHRQTKLDITVGLSHPNGLKTMAQLFTTDIHGEFFARASSTLVIPLWQRTNLEAGFLYDLSHRQDPGLKLGIWQEF